MSYQGPGLYNVGKYGINVTHISPEELLDKLNKEDDNFLENLDNCDTGTGGVVFIEKVGNSNFGDDIYKVYPIKITGKNIPFDVSKCEKDRWYCGTDITVFGSGTVKKQVFELSKKSTKESLALLFNKFIVENKEFKEIMSETVDPEGLTEKFASEFDVFLDKCSFEY